MCPTMEQPNPSSSNVLLTAGESITLSSSMANSKVWPPSVRTLPISPRSLSLLKGETHTQALIPIFTIATSYLVVAMTNLLMIPLSCGVLVGEASRPLPCGQNPPDASAW